MFGSHFSSIIDISSNFYLCLSTFERLFFAQPLIPYQLHSFFGDSRLDVLFNGSSCRFVRAVGAGYLLDLTCTERSTASSTSI